MAILLVVMVGKVTEWVPWITGLPLAKVAFFFTVAYWAREYRNLAPVRVRSLRIAKPVIAFFALSMLSVFFSIYQYNSLIASEASAILLITFVVLVKITQTMHHVERMLLALVGSAVSLTVGVLINYSGGRAHINDNFDPNDVAYVLDTLLPVVVAFGVAQSKRRKWLAYGFALAMIVAILLTGSRGGVIGLAVVVLALLAYPLNFSKTGELRGFAPGGMAVKLAFLAVLGVGMWGSFPGETRERLMTLADLKHDYNAGDSNASRTVLWRRDIGLALRRPIGYGLGSAAAADGRAGGQYRTAHNTFVQAFLELGILGLVFLVSAYVVTSKALGRISLRGQAKSVDHETAKAALYARALRIALLGTISAGFFLSEAYSSCLWIVVAIGASLAQVTAAAPPAASDPARVRVPLRTGAAA